MEENKEKELEEIKKAINKQSNTNIVVMTLLIILVLVLTGIIINDKFLSSDTIEEAAPAPVAVPSGTPTPVPTATPEAKVSCNDCVTRIDAVLEKTVEGKVLLGNDVKKIKIDNYNGNIQLDGKIINKLRAPHETTYEKVYIINNEVIFIIENGSYGCDSVISFYDKDGNKLNVNTTLDENYKEYPDAMDIASYDGNEKSGAMIDVQGNKIIITGIRFDKFEPGTEGLCSGGTVNAEYKGELYKAKYEIDYLGNNQFSKSKQLEVVETISDSICQ